MTKIIIKSDNKKSWKLEAEENNTILNLILKTSFNMPYSCMQGKCGICSCRVKTGKDLLLSEDGSYVESDVIKTCKTYVKYQSDRFVELETIF
ncbi:2Fe-2S iron-sulfur cluster-binding protein [Candidatus Absconditicoccus praedator]|uniref:2Fe-2S iron-sulfur cluster-binding protein n=1 Tax=Candidatus Absconditicoccus praedator TaxID=2735562 RepID=UPI001E50807B|nr:2Fe-2S iron-sulfur cluster binding domain-containing protein [Candidatus Absconditicoccus praedator]UFX82990.1 2Fe-2S iron-sulfur cluster binding domain-containing protein [Candidatus Absconditicoccus praedator]